MVVWLAALLALLVLASLVLTRLRQSLLVGYFVCGVAVANSAFFDGAADPAFHQRMDSLAEVGVVLLMFTLGIEFSFAELKHLRRFAFLGGFLQVVLTTLAAGGVAHVLGFGLGQSFLLGTALALSSTAVSLKGFQDLGLGTSPAARAALGIAIFQDLLVIVLMLALPLLTSAEVVDLRSVALRTGAQALAFLGLSALMARFVIPRLLYLVARSRSREMFTLMVHALCVGIACLASLLGLNYALGAFVAGLLVSGSIYSHRVMSDVLPFKDLFLTLFFVSIGLSIDLSVVRAHAGTVAVLTGAFLLGKWILNLLVTSILRLSFGSSCLAAAALASTGEFSLVLLAKVRSFLGWSDVSHQIVLTATALSMAIIPWFMKIARNGGGALELRLKARRGVSSVDSKSAETFSQTKQIEDHAVICGYGVVGRQLHEELRRSGIDCLVIELNVDTVRGLKAQAVPVLFADAGHRETWSLARIEVARLVALTFPDVKMALAAVAHVRDHAPGVPIVARTRTVMEREQLKAAGVNCLVCDEWEAASAVAVAGARLCGAPIFEE